MTYQGHTIFTAANGNWRVAILTTDNRTVVTDPNRYASEAAATLAAKRSHHDKPFINFIVVRG